MCIYLSYIITNKPIWKNVEICFLLYVFLYVIRRLGGLSRSPENSQDTRGKNAKFISVEVHFELFKEVSYLYYVKKNYDVIYRCPKINNSKIIPNKGI